LTRLFFSTDVHGSEKCFKKFVNAGKFYKADVLIMGGDLTGKMIIPIVKQSNEKYTAQLLGENYVIKEDEVDNFERKVKSIGFYPFVTSQEKMKELQSDPKKVDDLFKRLICNSIKEWIHLAEERLRNTGIKCFISAGNDDSFYIDEILKKSDYIIYPEGKVMYIDDDHEMISMGYANITPWKCPRDIPEEELHKKIEDMASQVKNISNCIFNFHCPPVNTSIDQAPKLDEEMRPVLQPGGKPEMASVGSISIRKAIEKYQPLLGLHGHIHESKGFCRIGRTFCVNPGTEYSEGILRGFLVKISDKGLGDYMFTTG
jgi:hypothetical protein